MTSMPFVPSSGKLDILVRVLQLTKRMRGVDTGGPAISIGTVMAAANSSARGTVTNDADDNFVLVSSDLPGVYDSLHGLNVA